MLFVVLLRPASRTPPSMGIFQQPILRQAPVPVVCVQGNLGMGVAGEAGRKKAGEGLLSSKSPFRHLHPPAGSPRGHTDTASESSVEG